MSIKLNLPDMPEQTSAYTEAKANGEFWTLDVLQTKYSRRYSKDALYANYPRNIIWLNSQLQTLPAATAAFLKAMHENQPDVMMDLLNRFPDIQLSYEKFDLYFLQAHFHDLEIIHLFLKTNVLTKEAREYLEEGIERYDIRKALRDGTRPEVAPYMQEWRAKLGFYPDLSLISQDPAMISADVFKTALYGLRAERSFSRAWEQAALAARCFKTVDEFKLFYETVATHSKFKKYREDNDMSLTLALTVLSIKGSLLQLAQADLTADEAQRAYVEKTLADVEPPRNIFYRGVCKRTPAQG